MLSESMDNLSVVIIAFKNFSRYIEKRAPGSKIASNFAIANAVSLPTPTSGVTPSRDRLKQIEGSNFTSTRGGSINLNVGANP